MGARSPRSAFHTVPKNIFPHTGGAAEAHRIWADAARDVYYHGENPAFVLALLRPEARGYLAASLHQLGCAKCRALHGSIGGVSDDIELPDVLTPSGVNPHIKSTVYCARLGGVKHATCVKCRKRRVLPAGSEVDEDEFQCSDVDTTCETGAERDPTEPPAKRRRTDAGAALLALVPQPWRHVVDKVPSRRLDAIADFVSGERLDGVVVYPPQDQIFAALDACKLDDVKIVIVGQDPYHGPGQAHGLAFSCTDGSIPRSLDNIFKELLADPDSGVSRYPTTGNLGAWARQGVLLLNRALTVQKGEANSHKDKGWAPVTDAIIDAVNNRTKGAVFILWGNEARGLAGTIKPRHRVIQSSHPSPNSHKKTTEPFTGSRCFSLANAKLRELQQAPVDWNLA